MSWYSRLRNAYSNINTQKLSRDTRVFKERLRYGLFNVKKDIDKNWDLNKLKVNFPGYYRVLKGTTQNFKQNMHSIDSRWSRYRDRAMRTFDSNVKNATRWFYSAGSARVRALMTAPNAVRDSLGKAYRSAKVSYLENKIQIKYDIEQYLRKNRKFFAQYKDKFVGFFKRSKRQTMIMVFGGLFMYGLGSNLPKAIADYQYRRDELRLREGKT